MAGLGLFGIAAGVIAVALVIAGFFAVGALFDESRHRGDGDAQREGIPWGWIVGLGGAGLCLLAAVGLLAVFWLRIF